MKNTIALLFFSLYIINTQCWDCNTRERRDYITLSDQEKKDYVDALDLLKKSGIYDEFVAIHNNTVNRLYAHGNAGFLPWHRRYMYEFENQIRRLGQRFACLTLPYWSFHTEAGNEANSIVFNEFGGPSDMYGNCVTKKPFSTWLTTQRGCLMRTFNSQFSFVGEAGMVDMIVNTLNYGVVGGFRSKLESAPHAAVHNYIGGGGGAMGTMLAPDDPIFFLLHANVDRLWAVWQDCHDFDQKNYIDQNGFPIIANVPMPFYIYDEHTISNMFKEFVTVADSFWIGKGRPLDYFYTVADQLVGIISTTTGGDICKWQQFELPKKKVIVNIASGSTPTPTPTPSPITPSENVQPSTSQNTNWQPSQSNNVKTPSNQVTNLQPSIPQSTNQNTRQPIPQNTNWQQSNNQNTRQPASNWQQSNNQNTRQPTPNWQQPTNQNMRQPSNPQNINLQQSNNQNTRQPTPNWQQPTNQNTRQPSNQKNNVMTPSVNIQRRIQKRETNNFDDMFRLSFEKQFEELERNYHQITRVYDRTRKQYQKISLEYAKNFHFSNHLIENKYSEICLKDPHLPKPLVLRKTAIEECKVVTQSGRKKYASEEWIRMVNMEDERNIFEPICAGQ